MAGVGDDAGYGFAIAKALAEAGATVCLAIWPPLYEIFRGMLERGRFDASRVLSDGTMLSFERTYPLDAAYDQISAVPEHVQANKRYRKLRDYSIEGLRDQLVADFGERPIDIVVHAVANAPEVQRPLLDTSRAGYLAAVSASAYSMVSLAAHLGPIARPGSALVSLTYLASRRVIPGYGGGMSSAKAALESDTRALAFEAGRRFGMRVNTISAGPLASRAATAIGRIDEVVAYCRRSSPLPQAIVASEVAHTAAFLASPLASGITGATVYVDKGFHVMGKALADDADSTAAG